MPEEIVAKPVTITPTGPVQTKLTDNIQSIIDKTVVAMDKAGIEKFEVDIYANGEAVRGALVYKINKHWSIDAGAILPYHGKLKYEAHTRIKF